MLMRLRRSSPCGAHSTRLMAVAMKGSRRGTRSSLSNGSMSARNAGFSSALWMSQQHRLYGTTAPLLIPPSSAPQRIAEHRIGMTSQPFTFMVPEGQSGVSSSPSHPLGFGLQVTKTGSVELTSIEKDSPAHRALLSCGEMNPEDKALLARTMVGDGEREERGFSVRLIAVNSIPIVSPAAQLGFFFPSLVGLNGADNGSSTGTRRTTPNTAAAASTATAVSSVSFVLRQKLKGSIGIEEGQQESWMSLSPLGDLLLNEYRKGDSSSIPSTTTPVEKKVADFSHISHVFGNLMSESGRTSTGTQGEKKRVENRPTTDTSTSTAVESRASPTAPKSTSIPSPSPAFRSTGAKEGSGGGNEKKVVPSLSHISHVFGNLMSESGRTGTRGEKSPTAPKSTSSQPQPQAPAPAPARKEEGKRDIPSPSPVIRSTGAKEGRSRTPGTGTKSEERGVEGLVDVLISLEAKNGAAPRNGVDRASNSKVVAGEDFELDALSLSAIAAFKLQQDRTRAARREADQANGSNKKKKKGKKKKGGKPQMAQGEPTVL